MWNLKPLYRSCVSSFRSWICVSFPRYAILCFEVAWVYFDRKMGNLGSARKPFYENHVSSFWLWSHDLATFRKSSKSCEYSFIANQAISIMFVNFVLNIMKTSRHINLCMEIEWVLHYDHELCELAMLRKLLFCFEVALIYFDCKMGELDSAHKP